MHKVTIKTLLRLLFTTHLTILFIVAAFSGIAHAKKALVTGERSGTLTIVDLDTDQVLKTIGVMPDKRRAYIGNRGSYSIPVVDLVGDEPVKTIQLSHTVMNLEVSPDGRFVSANSRTEPRVSRIATATNRVIWSLLIGKPAKKRNLWRRKTS